MLVLLAFLLLVLPSCGSPVPVPGAVTVALDEPPRNLDPRIGIDASSERIGQLVFSSLVKRAKDYSAEPDLATSWEIPDPQTYVFHLREGVTFHDGRPLTSKDVVYTFRTLLDGTIKTPKAGTFRLVESVEGPDPLTVIFKLKEPFAPFLWNLTRGGIGIVPEGSPPDLARNPVGSGAFRFVRYTQDEEIVLERYDPYYGEKPHVATVRFKIIPESIVRALELRKGSVDIAINVLPADMVEELRKSPELEVMEAPGTNYQYVAFNLKDSKFQDIRVRQAIAHAIDREKIIKYLWRNQARPATGVVPPGNWAYTPDVAAYPYNPERARRLLAEAGQSGLSFTFETSTDENSRLVAAVLQQQFREAGMNVDIRAMEAATFSDDIEKGNFQTYTRRWIGGNNDPDMFNLIFHSSMIPPEGSNRGFYANPEVDLLIEMGRRASTIEKRKAAYGRVQQIVADELPYVSLWYTNNVAVYNRRIEGMTLYPAGEYEFLAGITTRP